MSNAQTLRSYVDVQKVQLPIRAEKRLIPFAGTIPGATAGDSLIIGSLLPDFEYISIRLPHRGINSQGVPDISTSAYFKFLINPSQVTVNRQMLDSQALAKGGWQMGVWGEDFITINLQGKTPAKYFASGLTDMYTEFSMSYRNLADLELLVENNGFWFEGEQAREGPLAPNSARRTIKMHQDIELTVGEFVWSGMFDAMTIAQGAETPYLADFALTFIAWKERFRAGTPYKNCIPNNIQRGHATSIVAMQASLPPNLPNPGLPNSALPTGATDTTPTGAPASVPLSDYMQNMVTQA